MKLTAAKISLLTTLGFLTVSAVACSAAKSDDDAAVTVARSSLTRDTAPVVSPDDAETLRLDDDAFASDLYRTLSPTPAFAGQNMFFSPYSISLALAMASVGARGDTAAQMASALHFTLPQDRLHPAYDALDLALSSRGSSAVPGSNPFVLRVVNSMWAAPDMKIEAPFLDTLATSYGSDVRLVDFNQAAAARKAINGWVSDETNARIEELLPANAITRDTRMVLVDAIYFKAGWSQPFSKYGTAPAPFHAAGGDVTVDTMHAEGGFKYVEAGGYKAVELPYEGDALSFIAVLPDDLATFETGLDGKALSAIAPAPLPANTVIAVALPKFKIEGSSLSLKDTLKARGMVDAFDNTRANFTGMTGEPIVVSDVIHKAFIAVDEVGTEAAAATAVIFADAGVALPTPPTVIPMTLDKPFLFFIRDNATGAILFLGRIAKP
jgi:serpin B